jgi:hypothetical protein
MIAPWEVQVELHNRLKAIPGFAVFDGNAPQTHQGDHIVLGSATGIQRNAFANQGRDATETVHVFTRGDDSEKVRKGAELVRAAVEDSPWTVPGYAIGNVKVDFVSLEKEPGWRQVPIRIRIHVRAT